MLTTLATLELVICIAPSLNYRCIVNPIIQNNSMEKLSVVDNMEQLSAAIIIKNIFLQS